ncbi:hypothetical protein D9M71_742390 [compost metagenome]
MGDDHDMAIIRCFVSVVGHNLPVGVTDSTGCFTGCEVVSVSGNHAEDRGVEHRKVHQLPTTCGVTRLQSGHDADGGQQWGDQIAVRHSCLQRAGVLITGQLHDSGHGLHHRVHARALCVGAFTSKRGG